MPVPLIDVSIGLPEERGERKIIPPVNGGHYDMIIIGGGPAGMTAAVYAVRKRLLVLMVTQDIGGQVLLTSDVENYTGYSLISGSELIRRFEQQLARFELSQALGEEVSRLLSEDAGFAVITRQGTEYHAPTVLIASGKRSRPLGVPGADTLVGRGVSYCATCDAPLFDGRDVAVVGGGNSGLTAALDLLQIANRIYLIEKSSSLKADPVLIERAEKSGKVEKYLGFEVKGILGEKRVSGMEIQSGQTGEREALAVQGVFIEIGLVPNSGFAEGVVARNPRGEIIVDCACRTNLPGVFAAGDVTTVPEKQIVVAAGEGAKAALSAHRYLLGKK
ncbi:MAG: FAD-dependent oxidoreductase [Candidatus Latescibacterota bacterium]